MEKKALLGWLALASLPGALGAVVVLAGPPRALDVGCPGPLAGATLDHLGRCDHGSRARVSSSEDGPGHNPIFLVDGRIGPSVEKWVSGMQQGEPWAQVRFSSPQTVGRVVLHHAGEREDKDYTAADYRVQVEQAPDAWKDVAIIRDNRQSVATHAFTPVTTTAVRVVFSKPSWNNNPRARLFELEVHAR